MNSYKFFLLALIVVSAACSSEHEKKHDAAPSYIVYSPNAEPLNGGPLGRPTCEKAIAGWFERMSSAHNAVIPRDVFLADAQNQFQRMDIDHNGYLVSEELDRFRAPYRQQLGALKKNDPAEEEPKQKQGRKGGGKSHSGGETPQSDASLIDPVMSADANFDFRVTQEEFMTQAEDNFAKLDANHNGMLDRAEVLAFCPVEKK